MPKNTKWTPRMISYLKRHGKKKSNKQLCSHLGVSIGIMTRMKYKIGAGKFKQIYWSKQELQFLMDNYRTMGPADLTIQVQQNYPRKIPLTRRAVEKQMDYLELKRSAEETKNIQSKNASPGGRSYTITKNSASINLHDSYVVNAMAKTDVDLKKELLKFPDLVDLKRNSLILKRTINEQRHNH